jgi:Na+/proline symporter
MTPNPGEIADGRHAVRLANYERTERKSRRGVLIFMALLVAVVVVITVAAFAGLAQSPGFEISKRLPGEHPAIVQRAFYVAGAGERLVVIVRSGVTPAEATRFGCDVVAPALRERGLGIVFEIRNAQGFDLATHLSPCSMGA